MYFRVELFIGGTDYVTLVYKVAIYWRLLVEFFHDLYETLLLEDYLVSY